ncbi:PREDICTED: uncharacterized protein LOC107348601 [Acropora digitifera]|uniref:uncharacterized protein LOC107348601 n=1 Tax=Acropora digitifera TaxID=70779 RepID=UPI00077AADE1|nr:PREDICTED: uncharacterized protein LOC107348601 [Acropora digitifera]
MALIPRFAFFVLLLLPYQCKAKAENCRETQCRLLPVGDVASDFLWEASEEVKLIYINFTVIGKSRYYPRDPYDPWELQERFLPHRWIWARAASELMLCLSYDSLSAGFKTSQVKTIEVKLKDQPDGCLAKLKPRYQDLAVGRMLLQNVTSSISSDMWPDDTPMVCVEIISLGANIGYLCCDVHKEDTEPAKILCEKRIYVGKWVNIVGFFLSFVFTLFAPALPLALPDFVFNIEDEVEKENHPAEHTNWETTGYQRITNPPTVGQRGNHRGTRANRSNMEDATTRNDDNNTTQEETDQNTPSFLGNRRDKRRKEREFIPVDDSSPITLSTLLRESVKRFPEVPLSFNVKLAFMCFCVYPCVLYVRIGFHYIRSFTFINEIIKEQNICRGLFTQHFFSSDFKHPAVEIAIAFPLIFTSIVLVLFSRPKDFILEDNEVCQLCRTMSSKFRDLNFSLRVRRSLGDEIHRHLRIFHRYVWYALLRYGNSLVSICDLLLGGLREEMHQESRGRHLLCVGLRFISLIVALPFIIVGGVFCLLILIVVLIVSLLRFSPYGTVCKHFWTKNSEILRGIQVNCKGLGAFCGGMSFALLFLIFLALSFRLFSNSCFFVSYVVIYVIIKSALNPRIVTPFLAFFLVFTTNVYSCYSKTQGKYREVKKMIWTRLQELRLNSNVPKDTIRAELYWLVCDKVLPIKSEMCRMLLNMVLVVAFLFLALFSILLYGSENDISTFTTTISVFFTGSIPLLLSKVLTTNSNFIGWAKIEMEEEIDKAVTGKRDSSNLEALLQ